VSGQLLTQLNVGQGPGWVPEPVRTFCRSDKSVTPAGIPTHNRVARGLSAVRTTLLGTELRRMKSVCCPVEGRGRLEGCGREGASAVSVSNQRLQCTSWSQDCQ
jgi:hypothetical protein